MPTRLDHRRLLGMRIDATSYDDASARIVDWSADRIGRYVCVANVHMTMEAYDNPSFLSLVNDADLVTPDGMPLVWGLRRMGVHDATRVYGPTLTLHVCHAAARAGVPVGFYGGRPESLKGLIGAMRERLPALEVAYAESPPFRPATPAEDEATVAAILDSGTRILFVGLGCPKQETWMAAHRDRLPLIQIGVGAAFAFHAGDVRQAPAWLQSLGMEWAFRLAMEPRRLWKRYLVGNTRFVLAVFRQALRGGRGNFQ